MLFQCFVFVYIMYLFTLCLSVKPNINLYIGVHLNIKTYIQHWKKMSPFDWQKEKLRKIYTNTQEQRGIYLVTKKRWHDWPMFNLTPFLEYSTQSRLNQLVNMLFQCFVFVYTMYLFTLNLSVKPNFNLYIGVFTYFYLNHPFITI
jgi:hypothetical protein